MIDELSGQDTLHLVGLNLNDVIFRREGSDLLLSMYASGETIRAREHFDFSSRHGGQKALEFVRFSGGAVLNSDAISAQAVAGTSGDDTIWAHPDVGLIEVAEGNDIVHGQDGNDEIHGQTGNDTLNGGGGDDSLFGDAGDDQLNGDWGDDQLYGGDGNDTLNVGIDTLRFANGITYNQVASGLSKSGNDLVLKVNGSTANQVTLKDFFLGGDNLVETISSETGGQLTASQIFGAFGLGCTSSACCSF